MKLPTDPSRLHTRFARGNYVHIDGQSHEPLSCDCTPGCWGKHSEAWPKLVFSMEALAQEAFRLCHQEVDGTPRPEADRPGHGSYVLVGCELRFCDYQRLSAHAARLVELAPKPPSIGYQFVKGMHTHGHTRTKGAFSYRKLNSSLQEALRLAIESELPFEADDIGHIYDTCGGSYWFGDGEWILRLAVTVGHAQAARSFLRWRKRKDFRWPKEKFSFDGVDDGRVYDGRPKLDLLCVGAVLIWHDERVRVTSFAKDGKSLVACSYEPVITGMRRHGQGPKKRYTITVADLKGAS